VLLLNGRDFIASNGSFSRTAEINSLTTGRSTFSPTAKGCPLLTVIFDTPREALRSLSDKRLCLLKWALVLPIVCFSFSDSNYSRPMFDFVACILCKWFLWGEDFIASVVKFWPQSKHIGFCEFEDGTTPESNYSTVYSLHVLLVILNLYQSQTLNVCTH